MNPLHFRQNGKLPPKLELRNRKRTCSYLLDSVQRTNTLTTTRQQLAKCVTRRTPRGLLVLLGSSPAFLTMTLIAMYPAYVIDHVFALVFVEHLDVYS